MGWKGARRDIALLVCAVLIGEGGRLIAAYFLHGAAQAWVGGIAVLVGVVLLVVTIVDLRRRSVTAHADIANVRAQAHDATVTVTYPSRWYRIKRRWSRKSETM